MKTIDCITYFNEPLLFELRLNILNNFVDEFVVCEAKYTHAGRKKELNFDINRYKKFKDKINYIVVDNEPKDLKEINLADGPKNLIYRINAQKRIFHQMSLRFRNLL